jgi:hypothetical protein
VERNFLIFGHIHDFSTEHGAATLGPPVGLSDSSLAIAAARFSSTQQRISFVSVVCEPSFFGPQPAPADLRRLAKS